MMKGLGHLIRTMFGGKKPAPALPSHMVGTVECDQVKAPIASDNVLRRAMGAAAGEAAAAEEASRRIYRHEEPVAEVETLPTLFLHGKPAEEDAVNLAPPMEREADTEEPSLGATDLLASTSYVELDGPVPPAAELLLARQADEAVLEETAPDTESLLEEPQDAVEEDLAVEEQVEDVVLDEVAELPVVDTTEDSEGAVSIVATDDNGEPPVALVVEPVTDHEILAVQLDPVYPDVSPQALEVLYEAASAPDVVEAEPAVETVAGLVSAEDAPLLEEPEEPASEALAEETVAEDILPEEAPVESLASLADAMDDVVTQVGARAVARTSGKKAPAKKKAEPGTKRKKAGKALPDDAVWLTDALIWSQCGSWREFWLPPTDANSSQRIEEFRAHAAAGSLKVWAKADDSEEWTAITASHWKKAGFDPLAFLAGRENAFSQAPAPKSRKKADADAAPPKEPVKYRALMVSRTEVETLFGTAAEDGDTAAVA